MSVVGSSSSASTRTNWARLNVRNESDSPRASARYARSTTGSSRGTIKQNRPTPISSTP